MIISQMKTHVRDYKTMTKCLTALSDSCCSVSSSSRSTLNSRLSDLKVQPREANKYYCH